MLIHPPVRKHLKSLLLVACISLSVGGADAGTTTTSILNRTIQALPACLRYEVRGVCFFLTCSWFGCWVSTSVRVRHYVPDAIVSTYNDSLQHPWTEVGRPLSQAMASVGSAMVGSMMDSSANTSRPSHEEVTFKSVDVIGNPVGMLASSLSGAGLPDLPSQFSVPGIDELMAFPSQELPNIAAQWKAVPTQTGNTLIDAARRTAQAPAALLGSVNNMVNQIRTVQSGIGPVRDILNGSVDASQIGAATGKLIGVDLAALRQMGQAVKAISGSFSLLCPGAASAFTLHYQSDLDALFWRGVIPLEMLYPASWLAGSDDVTQGNPYTNTWGSRYPRTGEIAQPNPAKASAVLAERAVSIVKRPAQPHIYKRLVDNGAGGYRLFESEGAPMWQMVYPNNSGCIQFGANDSLSLSSFGDGQTPAEVGFIWNLWQRYDCCSRAGADFLFSIP